MTRNQITQRIKAVAESHKLIRYYSLGDPVEELKNNSDVTFPACFVDISTAQVSKADKKTYYNVTILLCDLVNVNEGAKDNESEVLSDLTGIAEDLFAMFHDPAYSQTWDVQTEMSLEYFRDQFTEVTGSVQAKFYMAGEFITNRCQIPLNS